MPEDIGLLMKQITDSISREGNSALKEINLTISQMRMLEYLEDHQDEDTSQRDLEEFFQVTHPTIIGLVKRLEEKGYVSTEISAVDRRVKHVKLTDAGHQIVNGSMAFHGKEASRMLDGFSKEDAAQLAALLTRVRDNVL